MCTGLHWSLPEGGPAPQLPHPSFAACCPLPCLLTPTPAPWYLPSSIPQHSHLLSSPPPLYALLSHGCPPQTAVGWSPHPASNALCNSKPQWGALSLHTGSGVPFPTVLFRGFTDSGLVIEWRRGVSYGALCVYHTVPGRAIFPPQVHRQGSWKVKWASQDASQGGAEVWTPAYLLDQSSPSRHPEPPSLSMHRQHA